MQELLLFFLHLRARAMVAIELEQAEEESSPLGVQ